MKFLTKIMALVIIIFAFIYFYKPEWLQGENYDVDTINVSQYVITPSPGKIFALNLKISSTTNYNIDSLGGAIQLYFDSVNIFDTRIIDLLDNSSEKNITLKTYIKQLENMQNKLENAISNLENSVIEENIKYNEYYQQKQVGDQEFFEGFNIKDVNLSLNGFDQSIKNGPIATKHRIIKNAGASILKRLKTIKYLIDAKLIILTDNEETIINNFYVIKGDLLQKLQKLKYQLETNRFTD